jgi:hypothetical protein
MGRGLGYVTSRPFLKLFVEKAIPKRAARSVVSAEDRYVSKCFCSRQSCSGVTPHWHTTWRAKSGSFWYPIHGNKTSPQAVTSNAEVLKRIIH